MNRKIRSTVRAMNEKKNLWMAIQFRGKMNVRNQFVCARARQQLNKGE